MAWLDRFQRRHRWAAFPIGVLYKFFDDQGSYLAALITYYGFVSLFPLLLLLASILGFVLSGDPDLQNRILDSAIGQFPIVGTELGRPGGLQGNTAAGLTYFRDAATLSPNDPSLLDDLARAQVASGQIAEGERTLSRLLAMPKMQNRRDLVMLRARCLTEMDRPVEAREILYKLAQTGDADPAVWKRLFELGRQLGDVRLQRQAASTLIAIAPNEPDGFVAMALCQKDMGEIDQAIVSLEKAMARTKTDPTPAKTLGMLRAQLGDRVGAARAFRKAAEMDPSDTRAQALAAEFEKGS